MSIFPILLLLTHGLNACDDLQPMAVSILIGAQIMQLFKLFFIIHAEMLLFFFLKNDFNFISLLIVLMYIFIFHNFSFS